MSKYYDASLVQIPSGYKAETLYSVLPANGDGDFDFERNSIATRVNAEGLIETVAVDVPRLDYPILNGVVQSCPALLLEPSRRNDFTYSELSSGTSNAGFAYISTTATVTANDIVSPSGAVTGAKLTTTTANNIFDFYKLYTTESDDLTYSLFVKKGDIGLIELSIIGAGVSSGTAVTFNLDEESYGTLGGDVISAFITNYGNGWYRVGITSSDSPIGSPVQRVRFPNAGYMYVWGIQLEAGSYATSYIPTAGTTVERAAEVCNGAGTSAEFNDSEGVLFAEIADFSNDSFRQLTISSGSNTNAVSIMNTTTLNQVLCFVNSGGVTQASISTTVNNTKDLNKVAIKYKTNDFSVFVNGFKTGVDTSGITPVGLDRLNFDNGAGGGAVYGKTKQLIAFDAALTDEQLEDLTSWDSFIEMAQAQQYLIY